MPQPSNAPSYYQIPLPSSAVHPPTISLRRSSQRVAVLQPRLGTRVVDPVRRRCGCLQPSMLPWSLASAVMQKFIVELRPKAFSELSSHCLHSYAVVRFMSGSLCSSVGGSSGGTLSIFCRGFSSALVDGCWSLLMAMTLMGYLQGIGRFKLRFYLKVG